ncbi:MAG: magnesium/cobalt transporter CorA, partial [Deltaproteobacteria bacterium]|nr:magnesium/cobalt transporter CorA [Deltaproteobacteria bacterium]
MSSLKNAAAKAGLPPGSLVHVGKAQEAASRISVIRYSQQAIATHDVRSIDEVLPDRGTEEITWVNVEGLKDIEIIESVGRNFNIHPLVLEDILNTHQRPKFEEFADYLFVVLKGLSFEPPALAVHYEQISILVLKNFIFTFKEKPDAIFDQITRRLQDCNGRLRTRGTDYLAYAIMDAVVDQYFALQDSLDEVIESVEERLLSNPTSQILAKIQRLKRELVFVRKSISPTRELLSGMARSESDLIDEKTRPYLRDVYDHAIRVTEAVDSSRDLITGMLDIYLSSVSNKMNEVMKVLTAFASIFIPLTFIVGVYG